MTQLFLIYHSRFETVVFCKPHNQEYFLFVCFKKDYYYSWKVSSFDLSEHLRGWSWSSHDWQYMHISWDICVNILGCTSYWVRATLSVCYLDYLFPAESWTSTNFYHIGNHQILKIQLDVYFQGVKMEILISMHHSSQLCLFTRRLPIENQTRYCIV